MMNNLAVNPMQMLAQFKQNPMGFLAQRRFNVPQSMANNPDEIINYLLQTKQISQDQLNAAYQQMGRLRGQN